MGESRLKSVEKSLEVELSIEARLLYAAYARKPLNLRMTSVVTLVIAVLGLQALPTGPLTLWVAALIGMVVLSTLECRAFQRAAPTLHQIARWQRLFMARSILAGLCWALGPSLMIPEVRDLQLLVFMTLLLAVCMVAMISLSEQRTSLQAFVAATVLPPALILWLTGAELQRFLALALTGGMLLVMVVGNRFHQSMRQVLESETRTRRVLDTALDAVIGMDAQGKITDWNHQAQVIFGWSRDEVIGRILDEIIFPKSLSQTQQNLCALFLGAAERTWVNRRTETRALRRCGEQFPAELAITHVKDDSTDCYTVFLADITDRKRAEQALQKQMQFVTALNQLAQLIADNEDADALLEGAVRLIGETLKADRALIYDISFKHAQVAGLCEWLNPQHPDISATLATYPLDFFRGGANELLRTQHYQISHADDINPCLVEDGSGQLLHRQMMIQSALWYPFDFKDQSYHVLVLNQVHSRRTWSLDEIEFMAAVCQQLSIALNKLKMLDAQAAADEDLRIAASAFESQQGGIVTDTDCTILRVNQAFTQITGYSAEEAIGQNGRILSSGRHDNAFYAVMWDSIHSTGGWQGEIWNRRKNGEIYPEWLAISVVVDAAGEVTHYVAAFSDLSVHKSAQDRINELAFYDSLTHLPNRQLLLDRLQQAKSACERSGHHGALLFIDLDNFKTLNETLGSVQGDLLLGLVATRLTNCIREGDTVARLGGDEFAVLLEGLHEDSITAAEQTQLVGQKILASLAATYSLGGADYRSTCSIGVTIFGEKSSAVADDPLKRSELALYQAKKSGRNALRFFEAQMQEAVTRRAALEADLHEAVVQQQFLLYYQAQVIGGNQITGAEVLVRWQHPQRGVVSPAEFIPLAEESGLILPLGHWVLETACKQLALWARQAEMADLKLAVNVSARQFRQPDFVAQVRTILNNTGANPKRLKLELTESLLVEDVAGIISKMSQLRVDGVSFSLDDFGTGYSSLTYLKRLPLDQLKIDQGFVRNILTDSNDAAIAKMVIALAGSLGLAVIAEGVETQAQAEFLAQLGCYDYQGYLFSKPLPLSDFIAFRHAGLPVLI